MLNLDPYLDEIEDIEPGETRRVNHTDCDAGEDTRRRLYITRTHSDEGKVLAYCHNCQQSGLHTSKQWTTYRNSKHEDNVTYTAVPSDVVTEPAGLIEDVKLWPTHAKSWYYANVPLSLGKWWGYKYDPSTDRVYIPRWKYAGRRESTPKDLVGYQLRDLTGRGRPKYITAQRKDMDQYSFIYPKQAKCTYVVIVEDLQSALHIIQATENEGKGAHLPGIYVNHGTRIDPTMMYIIAHNYGHCTVWLDNDGQHVINQAKLMQRTIQMYSSNIACRRVEDKSDPKHYDALMILEILDEVWY